MAQSSSAIPPRPEGLPAKPGFERLPPVVVVHDVFNLVALAVLNTLNGAFLMGIMPGRPLLLGSLLYFLVDLAWVGLIPRCVKSSLVIIVHHITSTILVLIPLNSPGRFTWCLAYCMLVEINTWLLIAKRTIPVALHLQEVLFYVSWVVLRCVWYPYLCVVFFKEWQAESAARGTPWNPILVAPIFQVLLTGLNLHWSWALFSKTRSARPKQL